MEINKATEGIKNMESPEILGNLTDTTDKIAETAKNLGENVKSSSFAVASTASSAVVSATNSVKQLIEPYANSNGAIFGLIFVIIVAGLTSYGLFLLVSGSIFNQSRIMVEGTRIPVLCNDYKQMPIVNAPVSGNGQRRSYSFWIYINEMNYKSLYKHVLHIAKKTETTIRSFSPVIFLDKTENIMYIRFSSSDTGYNNPVANAGNGDVATLTAATSVQTFQPTDIENLIQNHCGFKVGYIPLQRWVHIAIVVNENIMSSYIDGNLSKTINDNQHIHTLNLNNDGDLFTGGIQSATIGVGFSGLISKFVIYNYDLNQQDIYRDYNLGPIDGLLAKMGLGAYGVRSPIYQIT